MGGLDQETKLHGQRGGGHGQTREAIANEGKLFIKKMQARASSSTPSSRCLTTSLRLKSSVGPRIHSTDLFESLGEKKADPITKLVMKIWGSAGRAAALVSSQVWSACGTLRPSEIHTQVAGMHASAGDS